MTATLPSSSTIVLSAEDTAAFEALRMPEDADIAVLDKNGNQVDLPKRVQTTVLAAIKALTESGDVAITRMPEQLTSTSAADVLGISRPTLMKWARAGKIESFKVGTHTRFHRNDVLSLKSQLAKEQDEALERLRSFELESFGPLAD
ncbi:MULTISPECIES: helix-turn-helix domain-containing protein [Corynebacterium]|nr:MULTISPECIES: helix-turn-helix domain-containing protein [Corynebacterium]